MKAIMISIKPKWCAKIMNGEKTIEVRKNKALASAIQKLIDENGYADIYVYCTKGKEKLITYDRYLGSEVVDGYCCTDNENHIKYGANNILNGKVLFKFRCYKVDDYVYGRKWSWKVGAPMWGACNGYEHILKDACLTDDELRNYADDLSFYAIHIADLEIFDKPREISEFRNWKRFDCYNADFDYTTTEYRQIRLTKAPQNYCYVEIGK